MKRMMCLWLPNWPVQWRMIERPSDRKRPLVVHGLSHGGKIRVIACSRAARQRGVSPGMLLAEAQSLWPSTANVWFEPHDPLTDRQKLKEVAQFCRLLSPEIAIDPSESPDCLLLDVTGRDYCREHEIEVAEEAIDSLAERGYWAAAAVADTMGVAWAVVRARNLSPPGPPSPKRGGGEEYKPPSPLRRGGLGGEVVPGRVFIIPPGHNADALRPLPVEALRLHGPVVQALRELNIVRAGQLLALPRAELPARFGEQLLLAIDRALGIVPETLTPEKPDDPLEASWELEPPIGDGRVVAEVIEHLLERLLKRIPHEHSGIKRLLCSLNLINRQSVSIPIELLRPSGSQKNLMELVRLQIERLQIPAEVSAVTVRAVTVAPLEFEQDEIFGGSGSRMWKEVTGLLERMSSRLGPKAVLCPRLVADPQPEFAWRDDELSFSPLSASGRGAGGEGSAARGKRKPLPPTPSPKRGGGEINTRPTFLAQPSPVAVLSAYPGGSPKRIQFNARDYPIARSWGPERIETGWWRGDDIRRDYYIVEATSGERFWLFRNLTDGSWFLHGEFA